MQIFKISCIAQFFRKLVQYPKLKKFGVFENSGHVTYLQIYEFKNLRIYDVLNELLNYQEKACFLLIQDYYSRQSRQ